MKYFILAAMVFAMTGTAASAQIYIDRTNNNDDAQRSQARRAAVQAAQGEVDRAQAALDAANARIRANWKANPDMLAAERDLAIKQAAFDKGRTPVMDRLKQDSAYQSAAAQAETADRMVKMHQSVATIGDGTATTRPAASPTTLPAPSDSQVQAATEKLEQKSVLREMESKAIAADPAASAAQIDLDAARERMKMLTLQFDAAKLNDPDYKASLDQLNSAKSRLTAAAGQY